MTVLVMVASKHGSTWGIGEAIAEVLQERGLQVDLRQPTGEVEVSDYAAVVVGSAVYMTQWIPEARAFIDQNAEELGKKPVWLFSSGLSESASQDSNAGGGRALRAAVPNARAHRHFSGKLDIDHLSIVERAAIAAARGKYGDHRDFIAVREWANQIADELLATDN